MDSIENKPRSKRKLALLLLATTLLLVAAKIFNAQAALKDALDWIRSLGTEGILAFILIYIAACVLFLPGSVLTLGAGAIFGVVKGSLIVSIASTLGATCAFLIGRYLARKGVESKISSNLKFKAVDDAVAKEGWKIVGLTRLSPIFPFNLLNYAYGVTKVSLRDYVLASWMGMMPGTVMFVYIGSLAGEVARGAAGPAQWALRIVGFMATVAVTLYITRIAKRALAQKVTP